MPERFWDRDGDLERAGDSEDKTEAISWRGLKTETMTRRDMETETQS